ncbi:hypothetical protein EAG_09905 [Camponotus floridanus]|uniref:Uncharacterized protein n=1 Tax=Camponotus floridanus TaxID=104421 RepID=E2A6D0_CAMFO|nr:hypothetical protein EAG_09905 [Camponotus floridanus]
MEISFLRLASMCTRFDISWDMVTRGLECLLNNVSMPLLNVTPARYVTIPYHMFEWNDKKQREKGPPANRRLARDRHEIKKVIDGNRERAIGTAKPVGFVAGVYVHLLPALNYRERYRRGKEKEKKKKNSNSENASISSTITTGGCITTTFAQQWMSVCTAGSLSPDRLPFERATVQRPY